MKRTLQPTRIPWSDGSGEAAVLGPNGAGKTTMLSVISGLLSVRAMTRRVDHDHIRGCVRFETRVSNWGCITCDQGPYSGRAGGGALIAMDIVDEGLEILDDETCWRLLEQRSVGRIGLPTGGAPVILPVNYRVVNHNVVFATGPGMKLETARAHGFVAFQVDDFDETDSTGWSVLVAGVIDELDQPTRQLCAAIDTWAGGDRSHLVRIAIEFVSGRRICNGGSNADQPAPVGNQPPTVDLFPA